MSQGTDDVPGPGTSCAHCGAELPEGAMFCGECGRAVGSVPAPRRGDTNIIPPLDLDRIAAWRLGDATALRPVDVNPAVLDAGPRSGERRAVVSEGPGGDAAGADAAGPRVEDRVDAVGSAGRGADDGGTESLEADAGPDPSEPQDVGADGGTGDGTDGGTDGGLDGGTGGLAARDGRTGGVAPGSARADGASSGEVPQQHEHDLRVVGTGDEEVGGVEVGGAAAAPAAVGPESAPPTDDDADAARRARAALGGWAEARRRLGETVWPEAPVAPPAPRTPEPAAEQTYEDSRADVPAGPPPTRLIPPPAAARPFETRTVPPLAAPASSAVPVPPVVASPPLTHAAEPAPVAQPAAPPITEAPFRLPATAPAPAPTAPAPTAPAPAAPTPAAPTVATGATAAPAAAADDPEDVEATRIVQRRPNGARFVLQFSTGESATVFGSGLLGRNPNAEPTEYVDQLVIIVDPGKSVSKTHLEFGQDSGAFWILDRHSGNGTVLREPDAPPRRVEPGRRYRVERGSRIEIGEQFFVVS